MEKEAEQEGRVKEDFVAAASAESDQNYIAVPLLFHRRVQLEHHRKPP
ncbi:hypothetical protein A2U01_0116892, partial [Trifolium medium]|nr:hypothetical protein [Trifolium medium]